MDKAMLILLGPPALFVAMLVALEFGTRSGRRLLAQDPDVAKGTTASDGLVYALLGLLIAFTFSGAASRFDRRRDLIVAEANALGTAWMRLDLLPPEARAEVRALFTRYFDARLNLYAVPRQESAVRAAIEDAQRHQDTLWARAVQACGGAHLALAMPVLPPLNECFDLANDRTQAIFAHPPGAIFWLLVLFSLGGAFLAGQSMAVAKTSPLRYRLIFAGMLAITFYLIVDLEYPRVGLLRLDQHDQVLHDLRATMS